METGGEVDQEDINWLHIIAGTVLVAGFVLWLDYMRKRAYSTEDKHKELELKIARIEHAQFSSEAAA
jgi:uncharacterized membrane protein